MNQVFTLRKSFEKSWEHGKHLFACFLDLEKAYDWVLRDKLEGFAGVKVWMVCCSLPL